MGVVGGLWHRLFGTCPPSEMMDPWLLLRVARAGSTDSTLHTASTRHCASPIQSAVAGGPGRVEQQRQHLCGHWSVVIGFGVHICMHVCVSVCVPVVGWLDVYPCMFELTCLTVIWVWKSAPK